MAATVSTVWSGVLNGTLGTDLLAYPPEIGTAALRLSGITGPILLDGNGGAYLSTGTQGGYYFPNDPGDTDYCQTVTIDFLVPIPNHTFGPMLNADPGSTYWYIAYWASNQFSLIRKDGGGNHTLTTASWTPTTGTSYAVRLWRDANVIKLSIDGGTPLISFDDTANALPNIGRGGYFSAPGDSTATSTTGIHPQFLSTGPIPGAAPGVTIAPSDTNIIYDPLTWPGYKATTMGTLARMQVTGSALFGVRIDTAHIPGGDAMVISASYNNGPWEDTALSSSTTDYLLKSGLNPAANTTVRVIVRVINYANDAWTTPANAFPVVYWLVDTGGSTVAITTGALALKTYKAFWFGDSRFSGVKVVGTGVPSGNDGTYGIPRFVSDGLDAECSIFAHPGGGVALDSGVGNNVPKGYSATATAAARSLGFYNATDGTYISGGRFAVLPDYIFVGWAANDRTASGSDFQAAVTGALNLLRSWAPNAWIFYIIWDGQFRTEIRAAVTAAADSKIKYIEPYSAEGLAAYYIADTAVPGKNTRDGLHPNEQGSGAIAAEIAGRAEALILAGGGGGGGDTGSFCGFRWGTNW